MRTQHYDYYTPIIKWAEEKDILRKGRLRKQLLKSTEECLELQQAIESYSIGNEEEIDKIKDAIGDIYVTLVISTYMRVKNPYIHFRLIKLHNHTLPFECTVDFYTDTLKEYDKELYKLYTSEAKENLDIFLAKYIDFLNIIAVDFNLDIVDCIDYAYNTITKRKGKMIDETFVKDK